MMRNIATIVVVAAVGCTTVPAPRSERNAASVSTGQICEPSAPGWGAVEFEGLESYWNPIADGLQGSTESNVDCGGTWLRECGEPPVPRVTNLVSKKATLASNDCQQVQVSGTKLELELNGQSVHCFFPRGWEDGIVLLEEPPTTAGGLHDGSAAPSLNVQLRWAACAYGTAPQGGHPLNLVVRQYWALGRWLRQNVAGVEKLVLEGRSFGGFSAPITALVAAGDPDFPLAGVIAFAGFEAERTLDFQKLIAFTQGVLNAIDVPPVGPIRDDPEAVRTFLASAGAHSLADVDLLNFAEHWHWPYWLYMADEDETTHADSDTADLALAFTGTTGNDGIKVFVTERGSHSGDGYLQAAYLGDETDPYADLGSDGQHIELDLCRDISMFMDHEVKGQPVPVSTPIPIGDTVKEPHGPNYDELLIPQVGSGPTGTEPYLLVTGERLGLGSQLGADDSLIARPAEEEGEVDLFFGNLEGEVQRITVTADRELVPRWRRPLGIGIFSLLDVGGGQLFYASQDGRAGLLAAETGEVIVGVGPGAVGRYPRRPRLGAGVDTTTGAPVPLIFLTNLAGEIVGLDPTSLDVRFRDASTGFFEDWRFTDDQADPTAWIGLSRGHLVRARFSVPDGCVEIVAETSYLDQIPRTLMTLPEGMVLESDAGGTRAFAADGTSIADPMFPAEQALQILDPVPGTAMVSWAAGSVIGVAELAGGGMQLLAQGTMNLEPLSLATASSRLFGTTANGTIVELFATASSIGVVPLNIPTGGTMAIGVEPASDHLVEYADLVTGLSLVEISPDDAEPVRILHGGYSAKPSGYQVSGLTFHDGTAVLTYEGALAELENPSGPVLYTARTFDFHSGGGVKEPTLGALVGITEFASDGGFPFDVNHSVRIPDPISDPHTVHEYEKVTNQMAGSFNRGNSVNVGHDDDGHLVVHAGTAGGLVFRFVLDSTDGSLISSAHSTDDLGWKIADLELGTFDGQPALFAGTWLDHRELTGGTWILDPEGLGVIGHLDSGIGSWGIEQVDLEGDGSPELVVGAFSHIDVYREQGGDLVRVFRSEPLPTAYGAYGTIFPRDGQGHSCDGEAQKAGSNCTVAEILFGTTGGITRFRVLGAGEVPPAE